MTSVSDLRDVMRRQEDAHTDVLLAELETMFCKLTQEARRTTSSTGYIDLTIPAHTQEVNIETTCTTPLEAFQTESESAQQVRLNKIRTLFETAVNNAYKTATIEMEDNDHHAEEQLLDIANVLKGPEDLEFFRNNGLLVTTFLKEKFTNKQDVNSIKSEFSKKLMTRKIKQLKESGARGYLKWQNNLLGFAYMKSDKALMEDVLKLVQQLRLERLEEKRNRIKVKKTRVKVKQEPAPE